MTEDVITIAARYRGPSTSGNGGYVGGLLARRVEASRPGSIAEVTFRKPTPLDEPLALRTEEDGRAILQKDGQTIAEAQPGTMAIEAPRPPSWADCLEASSRGGSFAGSDYAICFSCGRNHPDGLHVFSAALANRDMVAAAWRPRADLAAADGTLPAEYLWSALDCSGGIALSLGRPPEDMLTGRMTARIDAGLRPLEEYRIIGWRIGEEGRKRYAGTAIYDASDRLRGLALATWIVLNRP